MTTPNNLEHRPVDRRKFLRATTAAAASPLALSASSYAKVVGSNARVNIGFIGCGGRAQAHINLIVRMALDNQGVTPMAVCDVWDGVDEEYDQSFGGSTTRRRYSQGLYPSAKKCGLEPGDPIASSRITADCWNSRMSMLCAFLRRITGTRGKRSMPSQQAKMSMLKNR